MMKDHDANPRFMRRIAMLSRYWFRILAGGVACAAGVLAVSLYSPSIYRATTFIMVSESKIGESSRDSNLQQMAMLPTFVPFVDNDALIDESLKKFHLDQPPYELTADRFRRRNYLDVRVPRSTRLLEVNVEFPDARLAADLANDIAQGAVRFNDRLNSTDTKATQEFLKTRLDQVREGMDKTTKRRLEIREQAHIEAREKDLTILLAEKDRLATRLQQLRQDLIQNENKARALEQVLADEPRTVSIKRSITGDRFTERAAEKLLPNETPLAVTEESLNLTREEIRQEYITANVASTSGTAVVKAAEERLEQVNKEISQLLSRITVLRSGIEAVDQDYTLASDAIKSASKEYQAASITVGSKSQDMKQIAPALVPERPVRPRILINTVMGFLLGVLLSCGAVVGIQGYRDMFVNTSFVEDEIEVVAVHRR
jgi:polysaccharide biosynthesis transport protein